ncbi:MAG: transketolase [Nanoarchaeota archaeon]|nr:transketolase [Nanoarchaeota archaeon]MCG2719081.1 transketolase [Nanoarchaeota archaeon]
MRNAYLDALYELAKNNKNVIALVADIGAIVYDKYREDFPDRFINCGVAESNMITVAAGLASCGKVPFTYTITPFITMRTYEQIRDDVCLHNANVKIVGVGAGLRYSTLGPTHHAIEDIAIMKTLPNMKIISPCDPIESKMATFAMAEIKGPVYFRIGTGGEPRIYDSSYKYQFGKGVVMRGGSDATIIATGGIVYDAIKASEELEKENISTRVINIHTIKPIDKEIIIKSARDTGIIVTVEEHNIEGGFGESVASVILENYNHQVKFKRLGIKDCFCSYYGSHQELKSHFGIGKKDMVREVKNLYKQKIHIGE